MNYTQPLVMVGGPHHRPEDNWPSVDNKPRILSKISAKPAAHKRSGRQCIFYKYEKYDVM
jgi:hypothetical protein